MRNKLLELINRYSTNNKTYLPYFIHLLFKIFFQIKKQYFKNQLNIYKSCFLKQKNTFSQPLVNQMCFYEYSNIA
jgi:hypothetical protein